MTTHMITHDLFIEAFTQSLWNVLPLSKKQSAHFSLFTHSGLLVIVFVRAEGMEREERVDVTTHMITHGLVIEAFSQSLAGSWHCQTKKMHTIHYCMNSNNEIKQYTCSVNLPFQLAT